MRIEIHFEGYDEFGDTSATLAYWARAVPEAGDDPHPILPMEPVLTHAAIPAQGAWVAWTGGRVLQVGERSAKRMGTAPDHFRVTVPLSLPTTRERAPRAGDERVVFSTAGYGARVLQSFSARSLRRSG